MSVRETEDHLATLAELAALRNCRDARCEWWHMRIRIMTRASLIRLAVLVIVLIGIAAGGLTYMVNMPGVTYTGPMPSLNAEQSQLAERLRSHVEVLATDIGARNMFRPDAYAQAEQYLFDQLEQFGYDMRLHEVIVTDRAQALDQAVCHNVIAEKVGITRPDEIIVIGAHYDTCGYTPGADDNASGVAGVLELARYFQAGEGDRTVRFVCFANEEPPFFWTEHMGSLQYAKTCQAAGENIVAMISLEMLGYYDDTPGSQQYPPPFSQLYPDRGNFIGFVGNLASRKLVHQAIGTFRAHAQIPSEGGALPGQIEGVGFSDHWSFFTLGYDAIMVTDTAHFRNPHYHEMSDTADTLDYDRMALVVEPLTHVVEDLVNAD